MIQAIKKLQGMNFNTKQQKNPGDNEQPPFAQVLSQAFETMPDEAYNLSLSQTVRQVSLQDLNQLVYFRK